LFVAGRALAVSRPASCPSSSRQPFTSPGDRFRSRQSPRHCCLRRRPVRGATLAT
jgi:hypothetical protein